MYKLIKNKYLDNYQYVHLVKSITGFQSYQIIWYSKQNINHFNLLTQFTQNTNACLIIFMYLYQQSKQTI